MDHSESGGIVLADSSLKKNDFLGSELEQAVDCSIDILFDSLHLRIQCGDLHLSSVKRTFCILG